MRSLLWNLQIAVVVGLEINQSTDREERGGEFTLYDLPQGNLE